MTVDSCAIAMIIDRSGSMYSIKEDTVGSVEQFVTDQKKEDGKGYLKMVQFDDTVETIYEFEDLSKVDEKKIREVYTPRGTTALLDAVGRTIADLSITLEKMDEVERPKRVVVAVITDGYENASSEYTKEQISKLVSEKTEKEGWEFVWLGATMDAVDVAASYGFSKDQSVRFTTNNMQETVSTLSTKVSSYRVGGSVAFAQEEREALVKGS